MTKRKTQIQTRREYGTGSISINNKIQRYTVRWTGPDNKIHSCSRFPLTAKGKKEAKEFLNKVNTTKNQEFTEEEEPLGKWIIKNLETKKNSILPSTLKRSQTACLMLPETLLNKPINQIQEEDIQDLYDNLLGHYQANTIHILHSLLSCTFRMASKERKLKYNIMQNITKPRIKKPKIIVYTPRETGIILHTIRKEYPKQKDSLLLLIRMLYGTGMRIGELLALEWKDINFKTQEIHVKKTLTENELGDSTKTRSGERLIPILSEKTLQLLKEKKEKKETKFLFETKKNQHENYTTINHWWQDVCKKTGIHKRIHCWRHTCATNLLKMNTPITEVSRILGHSNPSITMKVYSHATPNYNQVMIEQYKKSLHKR